MVLNGLVEGVEGFFSHLKYFLIKCIFGCFPCLIVFNANENIKFYPFLTPEGQHIAPTICWAPKLSFLKLGRVVY